MNTIIEKLRALIKMQIRREELNFASLGGGGQTMNIGALEWVLKQLDTLQEQPACESKFKVGDRIQFKGFGHNKYTIAKVEDNHYVDTSGNGMDMSYTDANFELVKEQPVCEGLEEEIQKYMSERWEFGCINPTTPVYLYDFTTDELKECARHFYEIGWIHLWEKECKGKKEVCVELKDEIERWLKEGAITDTRYDDFDERDIRTTARHFAKWQREQDDKELSEKIAAAYQLGLADKEKQMMKEAVEGEIINAGYPTKIELNTFYSKFEHGQKVKLIIIKED